MLLNILLMKDALLIVLDLVVVVVVSIGRSIVVQSVVVVVVAEEAVPLVVVVVAAAAAVRLAINRMGYISTSSTEELEVSPSATIANNDDGGGDIDVRVVVPWRCAIESSTVSASCGSIR
jgi:hypothetical protein